MTGKELLTILCKYINEELHITAIKGPSNNPAPVITPYVTVYLQNVRQVGDRMIPGPVHGGRRKSKAYMKVATVQFYEVEGDGRRCVQYRTHFSPTSSTSSWKRTLNREMTALMQAFPYGR